MLICFVSFIQSMEMFLKSTKSEPILPQKTQPLKRLVRSPASDSLTL